MVAFLSERERIFTYTHYYPMMNILLICLIIILPFFIQRLCRNVKAFRFIGSVITCFLVGLALGNLIPTSFMNHKLIKSFYEIFVPLGIVLMLLSTDIKQWLKASVRILFAYALQILSVILASLAAFFVLRDMLTDAPALTAMISATYIGGTPNMSAVKLAIGASEELFAGVFLSDLVASILYIIFIMVFAGRFFRKFLPPYSSKDSLQKKINNEIISFYSLPISKRFINIIIGFILAIIITAIAMTMHYLFFRTIDSINMMFIILTITSIAIIFSFIKSIRTLPGHFEAGDYLFNTFFLCVGALASFKEIISVNLTLLLYVSCILYGSFFIHFVFAKIFRLDRDTFILTSVAGVMSSPFIPAVAATLKNKDIIVPAIAASIGGLAIGNFIGITLATILSSFL